MKPKKPETLEQLVYNEEERHDYSISYEDMGRLLLAELRKRVRKLKVEDTGLIDSIYNSTIDEVLKLLRWK
jgi:hypothetical protein